MDYNQYSTVKSYTYTVGRFKILIIWAIFNFLKKRVSLYLTSLSCSFSDHLIWEISPIKGLPNLTGLLFYISNTETFLVIGIFILNKKSYLNLFLQIHSNLTYTANYDPYFNLELILRGKPSWIMTIPCVRGISLS